ncbi:MAG: hypothetical protein CMD68_03925 [Gammaproteobacteria bacterium]|nr:hypothetical protein [Gammaproteobacteria bacterium]|tara:strand:+ start:215 stop:664 length:450 start_codon:yes stop_codon:yes gene_type:complete
MDLINSFLIWFSDNPGILVSLGIFSIFIFLFSILGISWFVAHIPEDYFLGSRREPMEWGKNIPALRFLFLFIKNFFGILLILGGILMLILPGQGFLTIVTGLILINYPGKFRLEQKIVSMPSVFKTLNWIRMKANKTPLKKIPYLNKVK